MQSLELSHKTMHLLCSQGQVELEVYYEYDQPEECFAGVALWQTYKTVDPVWHHDIEMIEQYLNSQEGIEELTELHEQAQISQIQRCFN